MTQAKQLGIPIIGVCRGAQFLCVFAGGKLIQHTNGHHSTHNVLTSDGKLMSTSSCHHQMMYPIGVRDYQLLAWSQHKRSTCYEGEDNKPILAMNEEREPEVIYFPGVRGLAIQGHPEWMDDEEPFVRWCNSKVEELLLTENVNAS